MDTRPINARISATAIALCVLAGVFAVAAGYGWFGISRDYSNYASVYDELRLHDLFSNYRFERGYLFACWFCKFYLGLDFSQFYSLLAAISLLLKFRLLQRHSSAPLLAAAVYLMVLFPFYEYTQFRAALGIGFAFTAIDEYLNGRWFAALVLFAVAVLFHSTAAAMAAGAMAVLIVRNRTPGFAVAFFASIAFGASLLITAALSVLERINPLALGYINRTSQAKNPNLFSGENILIFLLILSSTIFLRPWRRREDKVFYLLSFWYPISYIAFLRVPVFAHRIAELFIFSYFLFVFRFDDFHRSRVPAFLMTIIGFWMLYESIAEGWLLVYSR
jgi:hypothetical protein